MKVEDKLAVNKYDIDRDSHVRVNEETCRMCKNRVCIFACPADCFKPAEEHIVFSYEGCLECGSCRLACDRQAIRWVYPRGGFGICYQYG